MATKEETRRFMEFHRKRSEEDARHELDAAKKAAEDELAYYRKVYANRRHDWGWKTNPYHEAAAAEVAQADRDHQEWLASEPGKDVGR